MSVQNAYAPTRVADSKLKDLFLSQLKDIYWAEQKLVKTLPKLRDAATAARLKQAFGDHLEETKNHVTRLEHVFELFGEEPTTQKCPAMAGIVDEGGDIIDETEEGTSQRDAGLIMAGQKAEHYEIATYGGMIQLAKTLGQHEAAETLIETLNEEKNADKLLTQIAENNANSQAAREKSKK